MQQFSLIFFDQILGDGRDEHLPKGEQLSKRKRSRQVHWSPMGCRPLLVTNRNRHTAPIWSRLVSIHLTPCIWHLFKCQDGGLPSLCYHHAAVSLSLPPVCSPSPSPLPSFVLSVFSSAQWVHCQNHVKNGLEKRSVISERVLLRENQPLENQASNRPCTCWLTFGCLYFVKE